MDRTWATDWTKCQKDTGQDVKSPDSNPRKRAENGYSTLARNIPKFHALNQLPIPFDPARLDDGDGIDKTLWKNKALYHETCRLMFNNTKLQRAEKRPNPAEPSDSTCGKIPRKTRDSKSTACFLCGDEGGCYMKP